MTFLPFLSPFHYLCVLVSWGWYSKFPRIGGVERRNLFSHRYEDQKSKITMSSGPYSLHSLQGRIHFCLFQPLVAQRFYWFWLHHSCLCLLLHMAFSSSSSVSFYFLFLLGYLLLHLGFKAHLDKLILKSLTASTKTLFLNKVTITGSEVRIWMYVWGVGVTIQHTLHFFRI